MTWDIKHMRKILWRVVRRHDRTPEDSKWKHVWYRVRVRVANRIRDMVLDSEGRWIP